MGVYELNPSNNYIPGISNPINININISHNNSKEQKSNNNIKKEKGYNDDSNFDNKSEINQINESGKTMKIININKMNNYIFNSKTNYANYKKVPHKKQDYNFISSGKNNMIDNNNKIKNNIFYTEHLAPQENDEDWFKTQYTNFNKIKDVNEFSINDYIKNKHQNNNKNNTMKQRRNLDEFVRYANKSQLNINNKPIIYTKALPIDFKNEKKIENLFILNNNTNNGHNLLYVIEPKNNMNDSNTKNIKYSTNKDYKTLINKYSYDKIILAKYLLLLEERQWYNELIKISNILLNKRNEEEILVSNKYIRKMVKLQEQFKWIIESLGIYFHNMIFGFENSNINFENNKYNLHENDKMKWFRGFKWKGIYIRVLPIEKNKILINEIKALNYFYFDYLQLLEEYEYNKENHLLYQLIFPLIAYTEINGFFLFGSALININSDEISIKKGKDNYNTISQFISLDNIIDKNNEVINLYYDISDSINYTGLLKREKNTIKNSNIDVLEKNFYIKDLLTSRLFSELNIFHFIRISNNKYLIFNLSEFIPNLLEFNKSNKSIEINFLSVINKKRIYYNTKYKPNVKINFKNSKSTKSKNDNLNPKDVLKNIYNINPYTTQLKTKDIIISNIYFRIIYQSQFVQDQDYKNKQFVDYLFNYDNDNLDLSNDTKIESTIVEPYVIIYDLNSSIKLKYSLIKSFYNQKNNIILNKLYYLSTNYISFFNSWCEMLNKNSFNIKNYSDLKENMNRYGISSQIKFFALVNINNPEILDIIKISLLVKVIKLSFNKGENDNIIYKLKNSNNFNNYNKKLLKNRKTKILYIINSILYSSEVISHSRHSFYSLLQDLVFYVNVIFLKLKLIDGYLSLGLLNINKNNSINISELSKQITGFDSPKNFLKHIISIAREKPFLFITELERKLGFVIDPYIKFKSSISIESMHNKLDISHISFNLNTNTKTFINVGELSGLILAKLIYLNSLNLDDNQSDLNSGLMNFNQRLVSDNLHFQGFNDLESKNKTYNNYTNIASKPTYMKTNINLSSYNNSLKSKENSSKFPLNNTSNNIISNNDKESEISFTHMKSNKTNDLILNSPIISENKSQIDSAYKEICNNFILILPSICYKMGYSYENIFTQIRDYSKYLKNIYFLPELNIFEQWNIKVNKLFHGIISSDCEIESSLLKTLIYLFIITFFIEKKFEEANQINMKIKDLFKKDNYQLSLQELALINLFQALSSENYIDSEKPYSKCLMLLLMCYGEPRGRNNDSHGILSFPLWKIARKTYKLEQSVINEYFKEMYQCLMFYEKGKNFLKLNNTKAKFNYSSNVYNIDSIKILGNICKSLNINSIISKNDEYNMVSNESRMSDFFSNNTSENPGADFFINLSKIINIDATLDENIFNDKILEKQIIKYYKFPSISKKDEKLDKRFYKNDFIIFILNEIQSLCFSKKMKYNEEYINSHISDEIFIPYPYNYKNNIPFNAINTNINESDSETDKRKKLKKEILSNDILSNYSINKNHQNINNFVMPSKTSFINKLLNNKKNISLINKKNNVESLLTISNNTIASMYNESKKNKERQKNKSVEGIKSKKYNIFSHFLYQEILQKLSYKLNAPSGTLIAFGNNTHNETSHDNYEKITIPRIIFKMKNIRIEHIFSGWEHNIILTNKGEIYSFGNNQHYQCGYPNNNINKIITNPTNISKINNNIKAISAACGNEYTLILSKDNEVYAFGNNEDGVLGLNDSKIKKYEFTKINFGIYTNKIKEISAGTVHNLALTEDNKLFSWGSSQGGQLGLPEKYLISQPNYIKSFFLSSPTQISIFSKSKKPEMIQKISCGEAHSIALTNKGMVYSWGFGSNGQLGLGFCEDSFEPGAGLSKSRIFVPNLIQDLNEEKIIDVKCGKTFSMFINDKNELFACGVNDLYQLGVTESSSKEHLFNKETPCYDYVYPIKIDCFLNMKVLKISCGEGHCLAVIKDLISNIITIWSWGNNKFGQLGQGSLLKKSPPNPINYLSEYNSKSFEEISCGGFHSLCLIKYRDNLNWIENDFKEIKNIIDDIGII